MTGAPMTDPHADVRTAEQAVDAAAEAMWRAEVAAFPAASYARSSEKWEEQADGVRVKWTDLARAALSVAARPTGDPSGAEEMRADFAAGARAGIEAAATKVALCYGKPGMTATKLLAEVRASMQFVDIPIPRPSTGGADGKSAEAIAEDIVSQVAVNEYQAHRLVDLIATALRASRATTEARVGELARAFIETPDPVNDMWDTEDGQYEEGATTSASDWSHHYADYQRSLRLDALRVALGYPPLLQPDDWRAKLDPPSIPTPPASEVEHG